jgi:hypothetical protein
MGQVARRPLKEVVLCSRNAASGLFKTNEKLFLNGEAFFVSELANVNLRK